jgi:hypothetical protein
MQFTRHVGWPHGREAVTLRGKNPRAIFAKGMRPFYRVSIEWREVSEENGAGPPPKYGPRAICIFTGNEDRLSPKSAPRIFVLLTYRRNGRTNLFRCQAKTPIRHGFSTTTRRH